MAIRKDNMTDSQYLCTAITRCLRDADDIHRPGFPVDTSSLRDAAVLVPLVERRGGLQVILTRRSEALTKHAGQISFPGGRVDPGDASPMAAALRECHEEIGLLSSGVDVLGSLPRYPTISGFMIHPFVGHVHNPGRLRAEPSEVAEIFEVPLAFFLDPANHQPHDVDVNGETYRLHAMPYGDYYIWGATAAILRELYQRLRSGAPDVFADVAEPVRQQAR
ncbi:CoA pyrophosphatase [Aquisalimonas asiatica]|uniref:8-oxo-dGTP pyrophosphatase MutT, NUDIX family n=1 Tax=Aquisalimonas asiatica TaxID=406100 RepID=A0A1H8QHA5_9GAMM|nr:CoA pyrophosphatase [Aquisalimonas asiatica]SEO53294.1 8-oxo-dGTP pyrophosphatase MutT, NUDIX family [Aquisalimonas asiatica]